MFRFDECTVDLARWQLTRAGEPVHVERQVFDVLVYLLTHRDRVVPKLELLDAVWGDRFVSDSAITSRLKAARRAVGDDGRQQRIIATVHGVGYRFVAPVVEDGASPVRRPGQAIRYCTTGDGVRIAYALSGSCLLYTSRCV